ncbi:tyrosine-type recombinase/integrase [Planctomycetes bacterium K23_9]|uniref:Phage integrase family protein n=1 Tax=Stieleria marina TaxID=1930275 RepID=A0A517NSI1_9BACT|nr:Phage integrase family protein [Planctomycetes bacterium K23_9]
MKNEDITASRLDALHRQTERFVQFAGELEPVTSIKSPILLQYYNHLLELGISDSYKRDCWATAKQMIRFAWEQEILSDLPRNIDSFSIAIGLQQLVLFEGYEIRMLVDESSERSKLFWLLMLNTGMQQKDVANLKHSEIDLEARTITRKRGKTKKHDNVPSVTYALWDCTAELLEKYVTEGEPAIKNVSGGSLYTEATKPDGKLKKTDAIKSAYFRVCKKTGRAKPLKALRKSTATFIENNYDEPLSQLFLCHAPRSVAGKNYVVPSMDRLAEALRSAEEHFFPEVEAESSE